MTFKRLALMGVIFGVGLGTTACTDGYGYSGVAVGYGGGGYYGDNYGYGDPYGGYGYGAYGGYPSYFGWYGDYYYPGTGIYVYDQYRRPFRWNDGQRRYWEGRRNGYRGDRNFRNDWNGFDRNRGGGTPGYQGYRGDRTPGYQGGNRRDGTPGYQGGNRRDGTPGYQGGRGDRGNWRGNRQTFSGTPGTATPQAVTPSAAPQQQRSEGGFRGGGSSRSNGGWRGRR